MENDLKKQLKAIKEILPTQDNTSKKTKPMETDMPFGSMIGRVTPLKPSNRYTPPQNKEQIKPRKQEDNTDIPAFYIGDNWVEVPSQYTKNGRGGQDIKNLLKHAYPIISTLDLHGQKQEGLQELLSEFCFYVRSKGVCGRIVHGSGLGSQQSRPVLKNIARTWLCQHPDVLAYTEEKNNDGAVLVLFKKQRDE